MSGIGNDITAGSIILPKKLFKNNFGFGLDFGSSIVKLAYTTVEADNLCVHLINFPREYHDEAIEFLKQKCEGNLKPGAEYDTTGVGVGPNIKDLEASLSIKCKISNEIEAAVDGFNFLAKTLRLDDFLYPANLAIRKLAGKSGKTFIDALCPAMLSVERCYQFTWNDALANIPKDGKMHYPVLMCIAGSGHYLYKVYDDDKYDFLDHYSMAGKTFLGLGKLLLGVQEFDDIMALAEKGNASALDQTSGDVGASKDDKRYNHLNIMTTKLFAFGCAANNSKKIDEFKREDIAAALVSMVANATAKDAFNWSRTHKINQVFFVGGMPGNHELFRNEIEKEFFEMCHANEGNHTSDCLFVKGGAHVAAIGSLLKNLELQ